MTMTFMEMPGTKESITVWLVFNASGFKDVLLELFNKIIGV